MHSRLHVQFILLLLIGTLTLAGCSRNDAAELQQLNATVFTTPRSLKDFSLIDQNNQVFNLARLHNKWSFLFFGYTHCPDICPNTLAIMNIIAKKLHDTDTQFVFISVDPYRDNPATLAKYVSYFNKDFIGVTEKTPGELAKLTKQLGILYLPVAKKDASNRDDYLVQHSADLLLTDPNGQWHALMSPPFDAANIVKEFQIIKKHFKG